MEPGAGRAGFPGLQRGRISRPKSADARNQSGGRACDRARQAPAGEAYDGPVLFEAQAAAQLFGQVAGRQPEADAQAGDRSRAALPLLASELENRVGSRILPEWMDVVDDPTQTEYHGHTLLGHYLYDIEGVAPQPLTLVEKGVLKTFLLTRTPVFKEYPGSNGHARMTGPFGDARAGFGNLFIRASQTTPAADMKKKLIDCASRSNKPYGILIRKLDYPSTASHRRIAANGAGRRGSHAIIPPLLAYKMYPDGREELVRGPVVSGDLRRVPSRTLWRPRTKTTCSI